MDVKVVKCCVWVLVFLCVELGGSYGVNETVLVSVDGASPVRQIPSTLFGVFFEEINHAGAGGLWAELVNNRGFEAGGLNTPSNINPWAMIGNDKYITLETEPTSCFERNKIALRMEIHCDLDGENKCPEGGVGISNPGYWGMNIEKGESYNVVLWMKSIGSVNLSVAFTSSNGSVLASSIISGSEIQNWTRMNLTLEAVATDHKASLSLTTSMKSIIWLDQVSAMPNDTFKGHGFRKDLANMMADLKPSFIRFPGGCFVEGVQLMNAFRWRQSIGPWEERPGHFGDVWGYWTDDGLGYYEFLQLAEDINALPVWVFNNGISHNEGVPTEVIEPFVQDVLNGIEFARGPLNSPWGKKRAVMGHPEPFDLRYVAIGNEDCAKEYYVGNYLKFYNAIKLAYPDIKVISNCDASNKALNHPADLYDFHIYTSARDMFDKSHKFDNTARTELKAFVSEYAVHGSDAGKGSFLAGLAEAGFLIGLELNSDVVEMASYAPLLVNSNNRRWNPDAIVFNSWQAYGTPSYWIQKLFKESSGAILLPVTILGNSTTQLLISAIKWTSDQNGEEFIKVKAVNYGGDYITLQLSLTGLPQETISPTGSKYFVYTSESLMSENSFDEPEKVVPQIKELSNAGTGTGMSTLLLPHSVTVLDLRMVSALHATF